MAATEETIGKYRLLGVLGEGGMGVIYKAEQMNLGRFVALKVLWPHLCSDPLTIKRFNHEARAAALLNHPNIVQIFDIGVDEDSRFIAMEYVPGRTLEQLIEKSGRRSPEETLRIVDQIAAALSAAHDVGIIHRDVKPSNVLLDDRGRVKVADFGIAVAAGQGETTDSGHLVGSVRYMSPEHARGEDLDNRSDLYSLGIVMYELLTGEPPFDGDFPEDILEKHVNEPPPPIRDDPPPMVRDLVMRCLEKRRVDRHRTMHEFRTALREAAADIEWTGPSLVSLGPSDETFTFDPSFQFDRAGVLRSMRDTMSFVLAERFGRRPGGLRRMADGILRRLHLRVGRKRDSYKLKRLEVVELEENLRRAEQQLERAKEECNRAHEKYETSDSELHEWQMHGSLVIQGTGSDVALSKSGAAVHEKKLWKQLTSYKLQWQDLQDRVRDWYQNVERVRRELEATRKEMDLLRRRRQYTAELSGVARRNRLHVSLSVVVVVGSALLGTIYWWAGRSTLKPSPRPVYGRFIDTGSMREPRDEHAAALLPSGNVLVAGGINRDRGVLRSAEIYDVSHGKFRPASPMQEARFNHTMTATVDGGVLVVGGQDKDTVLQSVERYIEADDRFVRASRLVIPRSRHRSILLKDGSILVTGGQSEKGKTLKSAELFDPRFNRFRIMGQMNSVRKDHAVTLLPNGRVVLSGGSRAGNVPVSGVEIYDPKTRRFEMLCTLSQPRYEHTATLIADDRVLITGGRKAQRLDENVLDSIELIDLKKATPSTIGRLRIPRKVHAAVLLPGTEPKRVLIVGGGAGREQNENLCEFFYCDSMRTVVAGSLRYNRNNHTATLLKDGAILFVGGYGRDTGSPLQTAELYTKVPPSVR